MKTSGMVAIVVASAVFVGCAQAPMNPRAGLMRPEKGECIDGRNCEVTVTVVCPAEASASCWLTAKPELMLLRQTDRNKKITWTLVAPTSDFKFHSPGIVIDPMAFRCEGSGPRERHCFSLRNGTEAYKYDINVVNDAGRRVDPYDPWVVVN